MKWVLQDCLYKKLRVERVGATFTTDINSDAPYLFEKVIKEFAHAQKEQDESLITDREGPSA